MKKVIASLMIFIAVILLSGLATATPSHAANTQTSITSSIGVAKAVPTIVTNSVTPVTSAPKVIGGGVIKPFWRYVSCYAAIDGYTWCWRYACTNMEYWFYGCRDGWYRVPKTWYV